MGLPEQVQLPTEDAMMLVESLFEKEPAEGDRILYIGNTEPLVEAVRTYCDEHQCLQPTGLAIELYEDRVEDLRAEYRETQFLHLDFLSADLGEFEYILGDPPDVSAQKLVGMGDVETYRDQFRVKGNFNLSSLHLEHALKHLTEEGRITMALPLRFATAESARPFRRYLSNEYHVTKLDMSHRPNFVDFIIMTVANEDPGPTHTLAGKVQLPKQGMNWLRVMRGIEFPADSDLLLENISRRIGAGVATGADDVFVMDIEEVPPQLDSEWIYPTIGGKQLSGYDEVKSDLRIVCPYTQDGRLASTDELGDTFLQWAELHREKLEARSSIQKQNKPWYAWAQPAPLEDVLQPKILTRDFADEVKFWLDDSGEYIPRRTVYYIVPKEHVDPEELIQYLNTPKVCNWIESAAPVEENRSYRISTRDLNKLPVPDSFATDS